MTNTLFLSLLIFLFQMPKGSADAPKFIPSPIAYKDYEFGMLPQRPYETNALHMALDIHAPTGTAVYSVSDGIITEGGADWIYTIIVKSSTGLMSYYMHLDKTTVPQNVRAAIEQKRTVRAKTFLGRLVAPGDNLFQETVTKSKSHVHFGLVDCNHGRHLNPLIFLDYEDHQPPKITSLFFRQEPFKLYDEVYNKEIHNYEVSQARTTVDDVNRTEISGEVVIVASAFDRIDNQTNLFPPHRIEWQINGLSSATRGHGIKNRVLFDASSFQEISESSNTEYCSDPWAYVSPTETAIKYGRGIYETDRRFIPYGQNIEGFFYSLTSLEKDVPNDVFPLKGTWNTALKDSKGNCVFPNGKYEVKVVAFDAKGNSSAMARAFSINNHSCFITHKTN